MRVVGIKLSAICPPEQARGVCSPSSSPGEDAAALAETISEDEFDNVLQVLALLHRRGGRHEVHHPEAVPEPQAHRIRRPGNCLVGGDVKSDIMPNCTLQLFL